MQKLHSTASTDEIISTVDIHYKNDLIYSKVDVMNTSTDTFLDSKFEVKLLDQKESVMMPGKFDGEKDMYFSNLKEHMTLSWIVIDPTLKRAINVSSLRPVAVRLHWIGGDIEVKYAIIVAGNGQRGMTKLVECRIMVMLGWKEGTQLELRGVKLEVKDMDDKCLSGKDSLGVLHEAMQSGKRKKGKKGEEKERYRKYVDLKRERKETKARRERRLKMLRKLIPIPAPAPATIFLALAFLALFLVVLLSLESRTVVLPYSIINYGSKSCFDVLSRK